MKSSLSPGEGLTQLTEGSELRVGDTVQLTLTAQPHVNPAAIRLRHSLKALLRIWGFRCVEVRQISAELSDDTRPTFGASESADRTTIAAPPAETVVA